MPTTYSDESLYRASLEADWRAHLSHDRFSPADYQRPPLKTLFLAILLFLLALGTCLVTGTHFARAYALNQAASTEEFTHAFTLFYKDPAALVAGLPFALTLLTILLAHELGHYFACRYHHIHSSYPFFIPFPSLIGTFGAFILIRSPIRTTRALFDVGASGPLVGFVFAIPALIYGVLHAKVVPGIADPKSAEFIFGTPLALHFIAAFFHPGVSASSLLLHPVGRAAWVGLFATSLNLLPASQLDGGHILRSASPKLHRYSSSCLPFFLIPLGHFFWPGWYIWAAILFGIRFLRMAPIYDPVPLDPRRRFGAFLCLLVFILSFMLAPL